MSPPVPGTARTGDEASRGSRARAIPAQAPRLALSKVEAAAALAMSVDSFERHVQPSLRCVYVGRLRLFAIGELERWLAESACAPSEGL